MSLIKVTFIRSHMPNQGAGYNSMEEASFGLEAAVTLVAKNIARFSNSADLEANWEAVEAARRSKPAPWARRWVKPERRRWG